MRRLANPMVIRFSAFCGKTLSQVFSRCGIMPPRYLQQRWNQGMSYTDFAQSYPQLMLQARNAGFSAPQQLQLRQAFELALVMTNGVYRAEGVPLLNHLVRCASIAIAQFRDCDMARAALLHAVYTLQEFDYNRFSLDLQGRRMEVRTLLGAELEEVLWAYEFTPWFGKQCLENYVRNLDSQTALVRKIIALRLVNELEDHMDNAMAYSQEQRQQRRSTLFSTLCLELAELMKLDVIVAGIHATLENSYAVDKALMWNHRQGYELRERKWQASFLERVGRFGRRLFRLRAKASPSMN